MTDVNDLARLREYVDGGSEAAFAEIVQRHVHLVYSVALRLTNDPQDAQDVTQAVFVILAAKAGRLRPKTILTGWLYETTRFTAMNFLTRKTRRQAREQEAYMQSTLTGPEAENIWPQLAPLLEGAMSRLNEKDRVLIALRFYENRNIAETAALLGINEWAARKRVERVMEKLRAYLSKRGVTSTAATIAGAISANSIQTAPAVLIKTVTAVALAKGATASTSTLTLIKGALKLMAWSNAKTAVVATAAVILTAGTTTVVIKKVHGPQVTVYRPIPDKEPDVTARVWALDQGKMRAEDYTPEYWQQVQQSRQSFNPDPVKVAAAVGPLVNVTLVERTTDHGRPSYLYRLKYEKLKTSVLFRLILDGEKIAYAQGYPEPK